MLLELSLGGLALERERRVVHSRHGTRAMSSRQRLGLTVGIHPERSQRRASRLSTSSTLDPHLPGPTWQPPLTAPAPLTRARGGKAVSQREREESEAVEAGNGASRARTGDLLGAIRRRAQRVGCPGASQGAPDAP